MSMISKNVELLLESKRAKVSKLTQGLDEKAFQKISKSLQLLNDVLLDSPGLGFRKGYLTLADFLIFNELIGLSLTGQSLFLYPRVREYLNYISCIGSSILIQVNKPIEKLCQRERLPYYLNIPKL